MFPLLSSLLILIMTPIISTQFWSIRVSTLILISFLSIISLYQPILSPSILNQTFSSDQLSSPLITLTLWIAALIILARIKTLHNNNKPKIFILNISLLTVILIISFSVSNFINFYIIFESSLLPTLILILRWGYQPERLQARIYLILYTITARLPLLFSLTILINKNGTISIFLPTPPNQLFFEPLQSAWWIITILAFLVKMPIYIFHLWLPKAHVEAPIAGSIVLAGLLLKLGSYGLLRISFLYPKLIFNLRPIINGIALWGGVITRFICLRQRDIKSLIAYSSIGHIALVTIGVTLLSPWGWQGALIIIVAHGLCSSCLFTLANLTYETTHTRSIFLTKGLLCLFPAISIWWFIISIINIAAPPSINIFAEISLLISAIWASPFYIIPLGICSFLTAAYSLFLFTSTNHGNSRQIFNPISILSPNAYSLCLFHAFPVFLLILKPEIISSWF